MVETMTLPIPAVDVLGEQLNLNVRQYPFDVPRLAEAGTDRERIVHQVWADLESTGVAQSGRPEPEVEDALYLLCSSEVSVAAAGLLDVRTGHRLAARVVATGEVGVVGYIDGRALRMNFISPDDLPSVCADLLPDAPAGAGEPVSAPAVLPLRNDRPEPGDAARALESITGRPKYRLGHYVVTSTDRRGRRGKLPGLTWFDNDRGRYVLRGNQDRQGQELLTCGPADKPHLANLIGGMLDRARLV